MWVLLGEGWWAVPAGLAAAGAGIGAWAGGRMRRGARARRLELDAAQHAVRAGRRALTASRAQVQSARAALVRTDAERMGGRASLADVADARRALKQAQRDQAAATADLVARRADVRAARASLPSAADGPEALPLSRLTATHDAITGEWLSYETDPARAIAYPSMADAREPLTAAFLSAQQRASWLRPTVSATVARRGKRVEPTMPPADFAAYREAVRTMARTFAAAEREAWRRAGEARGHDPAPDVWRSLQDAWHTASRTIAQSADAIARAAASFPRRRPRE